MKILDGKYVSFRKDGKLFEGKATLFVHAGEILSEKQLLHYLDLRPDDRFFKSVRGPAKVDRVIVEKLNGGYFISPAFLFF